jgi:hypothetical protein
MKATMQTGIIWLFLLFVTGSSLRLYFKANSRANRMKSNLIAANAEAEVFKTKDGHTASKLIAQELTISELRKVNPTIISQLKNLYIPPRLAVSYTAASQEMKAEVKAVITDSVPCSTGINSEPRDTVKIRVLKYRDKWISITGVLDPDTAKITVLATDTIFTAIYRGDRRHPWAWFLSKRQYTAAATNRNPYIKINVIQSGVIKK